MQFLHVRRVESREWRVESGVVKINSVVFLNKVKDLVIECLQLFTRVRFFPPFTLKGVLSKDIYSAFSYRVKLETRVTVSE